VSLLEGLDEGRPCFYPESENRALSIFRVPDDNYATGLAYFNAIIAPLTAARGLTPYRARALRVAIVMNQFRLRSHQTLGQARPRTQLADELWLSPYWAPGGLPEDRSTVGERVRLCGPATKP
jgi:hypothetical protein